MSLDGALGDGEPEAGAAAVGVASLLDAEEWIEDAAEGVLGDAGAVVADDDDGVLVFLGDVDR